MGECICSSCRNLKGILDDNGAIEEYECEFGFPSESCTDCEEAECDIACSHYDCDDEAEDPVTVTCKACGKELRQVCSDDGTGEAYCFDCYLSGKN